MYQHLTKLLLAGVIAIPLGLAGAPSMADDDDEIPAWVWAAVGGVAGALILGGVGYRVWLSRRRPPEP